MRAAGRVVAQTLLAVQAAAVPGVRLRELDEMAQTAIREAGALPSFLGYRPAWAPTPFNGALCLSPNEVVVHGRPNGRRLRDGDLLSIDCGAIADGWHGDAAVTMRVSSGPDDDPNDARLLRATELALQAGVAAAVPGATLLDVAASIHAVARAHGYANLPDHGGHGIGRNMHEAPLVPNEPTSDAARQATGVRAVLCTPAHQYPTGVTLSAERREQLLRWADSVGGLILADDYDAEFRYERSALPCLQGMSPSHVALLGSMSKSLAPALRIGWVVTPPQLLPALRRGQERRRLRHQRLGPVRPVGAAGVGSVRPARPNRPPPLRSTARGVHARPVVAVARLVGPGQRRWPAPDGRPCHPMFPNAR